jgi:lipid-A-disaccharide synthase
MAANIGHEAGMTLNATLESHSDRPLRIFIVTGEPSGDALAASCIDALRERLAPREIVLSGVGGDMLAQRGLTSLFPQQDMAVMGVAAVVQRLPLLLKRIRQTIRAALEVAPDLILTVDSPDFCFRVTKAVRKKSPLMPVVHWVCPSVWAWRPGRARKMQAHIDHVLCLLPFEPNELVTLQGPLGHYVGHPLIEQLDVLRPQTADEVNFRADAENPVILILPGSRRSEVTRLMDVFGTAVADIHAALPNARFILPAVGHVRPSIEAAIASWSVPVEIVHGTAAKLAAFRQARVALAASGTVTLELALSAVPTVAAYRVANWEAAIARRLVRVSSAILPNLILGRNIVPEFIQEDCTAPALVQAVLSAVAEGSARQVQLEGFAQLETVMVASGTHPSQKAAQIIADILIKNTTQA